ncbi:MAG: hypothetical protein HKN87_17670 [Saprospiraceae bacterium]|nr:hypothetical protein [Saprospiraceae bacterium]
MSASGISQNYLDASFYSDAFETERWYRIYLPKNYRDTKHLQYPVVYYFHGYGGRYKWDAYALEDDVHYPENGRREPPFVMEWSRYVQSNDAIIVTWDGYEPNLHPGKRKREGIPYGSCPPYDYTRAHDTKDHHWGWDYRIHFRELVDHIDKTYRTIPDRNHRAITGLSMGGLTAQYIAGQNKDLIGSVSSFDPADNFPLYGPKGRQVVWPNLEMYRALSGIPSRLTMTDGDWLKVNDWKLKRIYQTVYGKAFDFHLASYPNHWAADISQQLDFHMHLFAKPSDITSSWNHICPGFDRFQVWDYSFAVERHDPALTILEDMQEDQMKIYCRYFIPDGPIVPDEQTTVKTGPRYEAASIHNLILYNLSSGTFSRQNIESTHEGELKFSIPGGGHLIGINRRDHKRPLLKIAIDHNQTYHYFEEGESMHLDFHVVNIGNAIAHDIEITATTIDPDLQIAEPSIQLKKLRPHQARAFKGAFNFHLRTHRDTTYISSIDLITTIQGEPIDTQKILFHPTPTSPTITMSDLLILDGRRVDSVPIYQQGPNKVVLKSLSGGKGNGNGIINPGEEVLLYVRLAQGMGPNDQNTFHRTTLLNHYDLPYATVERLHYLERTNQAGMTSVASVISISKDWPEDEPMHMWLKTESLFNDKDDPTSNATIYQEKYDYRRVKLSVRKIQK